MEELRTFNFEGRSISYTFRPAEVASAPLLVILHGHTKTPRPSKFKDPRWNVLCPVDNFGFNGYGSWFLGEGGDLFWLRAMPALISHVYSGNKLFFAGSSMGGYGAILHGTLNKACAVYANVAQTKLLGSTYSAQGMSRYFAPIFGESLDHDCNDLRNFIVKGMPTTFIVSGFRFDKENYLEEQTFSFLEKLVEANVNFSHELRLGTGHTLTHSVVEISELFLNNYENILQNFQEKTAAEQASAEQTAGYPKTKPEVGKLLLNKGLWFVERYGVAELGDKINWRMDPFNNRSWVWLLHQFNFIPSLVAFDRQEKGIDGGVWAMKAVRSWWRLYAQPDTAAEIAWHDHGSAKRVENLVLLRKHMRGQLNNDERVTHSDFRLLRTIYETHAHFLADEKTYSKGTNHGLEQALALFILSCESRAETWSADFKKLSVERILHEVSVAFSDDSGHNENSPQYQKYGIWQLLKIEALFKKYQGDLADFKIDLRQKINDATLTLAYMIAPNGSYCPIGDTEAIPYPDIFNGHEIPEAHAVLTFALTKGQQGKAPLAAGIIRPSSGWAAMRSGWNDDNDLHILTKSAFNSHYHRHDDDTSFVLNAFGEEWITDGGLYKYVENDPMRIHLRSHFAHSLSSPDGIDPTRKLEDVARRNAIENGSIAANESFVQMISYMFPNYISKRRIGLKDRVVEICDQLSPISKRNSAKFCTTRFLIPNDKKIEIEPNGVKVLGKSSTLFISTSRTPHQINIVTGQKDPVIRGWQSRKFNTFEPAHSIEFQYAGGSLDATYRFNFEN